YENELYKLLIKLDVVDRDDAESIREAPKALVAAVEKELDKLDEEKKTAWRNWTVVADIGAAASASSSAPQTPSEPREDSSESGSTWIAPISAAAGEDIVVTACSNLLSTKPFQLPPVGNPSLLRFST
ncbi:hypothetical protein FRC01_005095, partial [Tulasnella sp. 417]